MTQKVLIFDKSQESSQKALKNVGYPALPQSDKFWRQSALDEIQNMVHESEKEISTILSFVDLDDHAGEKSSTRHMLDVARFSPFWKNISWNNYTLPGQGTELETCGKWGFRGCLNTFEHEQNKTYVDSFQKQCCRSTCPECVESWTNRQANSMTRRVTAWAEITKSKCSHIVISLHESMYDMEVKEIKKLLKKVKKDIGITGSVDIPHPFRFKRDGKGTPYVSPHYHLMAFGWIKGDKVKQVYEKYGIFIKKIRTVETQKIFPTCKYILTHAGVKPHVHTAVYTGSLSYSKLKLPKEVIEPSMCPYCPMELVLLRINTSYLDKPPPFDVGFTGLTDFEGFEYITDYDYHFYDSQWNMTSTKEANLRKKAIQETAEILKKRVAEKQRLKSKGTQKLELYN